MLTSFAQHPSRHAWVGAFDVEALPILGKTIFEIEDWRPHEDQVDAHLLAEFVARDPLMTVKLFAHLAQMRPGREDSVPETVTGCLLMLGIPPFFTRFQALISVDEHLLFDPAALEGLMSVLDRSRRAADFALAFAVHRMDHDAPLIYSAALLHELAEMLLWLKAPGLAKEIVRRQGGDQQLRSADAQRDVLHITLAQLQKELMRRWYLPLALTSLIDPGSTAHSAQARNVELATRIARHSSSGWDNPAIPDDVRDIADFLQIGLEPTKHLLHEIDN
jgi:HD-like signal output (HDOD) protein